MNLRSATKTTLLVLAPCIIFLAACIDGGRLEGGERGKQAAEKTTGSTGEAPTTQGAPPVKGKVVEAMDSGGYTYVRVQTDGKELWAAAPATSVKVGDQVMVPEGAPMANFYSKTLERTFPMIYFVSGIAVMGTGAQPDSASHPDVSAAHASARASSKAAPVALDFSDIERPDDGKTVAELFEQGDALANQEVVLRGKVAKVNTQIMGKNWLHVQDGTGTDGTNDMVITTSDIAKLGDTILVRGNLSVNKDFGYGYKFDILIEDARLTVESQ